LLCYGIQERNIIDYQLVEIQKPSQVKISKEKGSFAHEIELTEFPDEVADEELLKLYS
jgi:hypothetical protein